MWTLYNLRTLPDCWAKPRHLTGMLPNYKTKPENNTAHPKYTNVTPTTHTHRHTQSTHSHAFMLLLAVGIKN